MKKVLFLAVLPLALLVLAPRLGAGEEKPAVSALSAVDEIAKEVERLRGLAFRKSFERKEISPARVREMALEMIRKELPDKKRAALTRLGARLGFWPESTDLLKCFGDFLEGGVAGLYDPDTRTFYLVRGFSGEGARPVIFHELVHALEDQYFDLQAVEREFSDDSDRMMAARAVVEGSAAYYQRRFEEAHPAARRAMERDALKMVLRQMKMLLVTPPALIAEFGIFPYSNARAFFAAVTGGDPAKVEALYRELPDSTEQILHPEKYGPRGDRPFRIDLPDPGPVLPEGWKPLREDTVGELGIGLLLNEFGGGAAPFRLLRITDMRSESLRFRGSVKRASEGWDGDRAMVFAGPGAGTGLIWASRWDTERDAREFAEAYREGLPYKWESLKLAPPTARVEVRGDRVLVVEGFPAAAVPGIAERAWKALTFTPDPRDPADRPAPERPLPKDR